MKQNTSFRLHILPWILYGILTAATVVLAIVKCTLSPKVLSVFNTAVFAGSGAALGLCLILVTNRKFRKDTKAWSKKDYLALKNSMAFCWICCLLVNLTVTSFSWVYAICLPVSAGCIPYMALYIPQYIKIREEILERSSRTTEK